MTVSTWSMFIKTDDTWKIDRPTVNGLGYGSPYKYATEQDALTELEHCYPDEVRTQQEGGPRTHTVAPTDWNGIEADKLRYRGSQETNEMTRTRIDWSPEYAQKVLRAAALTLYMERTPLHHDVTSLLPNVREVRDLAQILDSGCMLLEPTE